MAGAIRADLIVTLEPRDEDGAEIDGPIPAGSLVEVDVLLSIEEDDDPVVDLRDLQFDFAATDEGIDIETFSWRVDQDAYDLRSESLPAPLAATRATMSVAGLLDLSTVPVRVAILEIIVHDDGELNAIGPTDEDRTSEASFTAGFETPDIFSLFESNLDGGTFGFEVTAGTVDTDGDGVPDSEDAFPDDPDESVDTDEDEIGNNADLDDDGDGVDDDDDAFPLDENETIDSDEDGVGDNADEFDDDPDETTDTDDDGVGNNADTDDDNDDFEDTDDAFPLDPTEWRDSDGDGIGDNEEMNSNMGPRATGGLCGSTGGLCGVGGASTLLLSFLGLHVLGGRGRKSLIP